MYPSENATRMQFNGVRSSSRPCDVAQMQRGDLLNRRLSGFTLTQVAAWVFVLVPCLCRQANAAIVVTFELTVNNTSGSSGDILAFAAPGSDSLGSFHSVLKISSEAPNLVFTDGNGVGVNQGGDIIDGYLLSFATPEVLDAVGGPYRFTGFKTLTLTSYQTVNHGFTLTDAISPSVSSANIGSTTTAGDPSLVHFDLASAPFTSPVTRFSLIGDMDRKIDSGFQVRSITAEFVRDASAVPEPTSVAGLAVCGGVFLVDRVYRRRKRRGQQNGSTM
ncbi:hypothetical protein Rcae01_03687 [Novipirellula caenicola]|uniref:PEP-CTERM protein-sorting domain-containing protein n=2 Tax=Novipirellula caenicola TaxID=1536901 RepID=A0ABP9VU55_9BACT